MRVTIDIPDTIVKYLEEYIRTATKPPYVDANGNTVIEPMFRRGIPEFIEEILTANFEHYLPVHAPERVAVAQKIQALQDQIRRAIRPSCEECKDAGD
jgi:hypothetical protein